MKTYQDFISEAKKCWPGYKKKGTQKLFGKTYNRCVKEDNIDEAKSDSDLSKDQKVAVRNKRRGMNTVDRMMVHLDDRREKKQRGEKEDNWWKTKFVKDKSGKLSKYRDWHVSNQSDRRAKVEVEEFEYELEEGQVEWDNPKRPLQSGLTPREKNRAVRKRLGIENTDNPSFFKGGPSERDYERYGKLKAAHDTEKDKKVPKEKLHKFKSVAKGRLGGEYSAGRIRRMAGVHKGESEGRSAEKGTGPHAMMSQVQGGKERREKNIKRYGDYADLKRLEEPKEGFEYELEESSTGERSGRRTRGNVILARGRGADMTRQERTTAAIAKKAGLKGTGKYSTKDLRTKAKDYTTYDSEDDLDDIGSTKQDHFIRTHASARKAAKGEHLIKKYKPAGKTPTGMTRLKTAPSSESVRRVKDLKKNITKAGANKRGPVHTVDIIHRDSGVVKNDPDKQMERGRNFIAAVKDTPNQLKKAGAKKGEAVTGRPSAVMPGETTDLEKKKTGENKRAKLYKKIFGKRSTEKSAKTGLMVGKVDK